MPDESLARDAYTVARRFDPNFDRAFDKAVRTAR